MTELRLNTICSFYSFIEYLEFFRIDFGINLSSFRKNEGREFRGLWEERTCISLAWSPRTAAALLDTERGTESRKEDFTSFKLYFPFFLSSQQSTDWSRWKTRQPAASQHTGTGLPLRTLASSPQHLHEQALQMRKHRGIEAADLLLGLPTTLLSLHPSSHCRGSSSSRPRFCFLYFCNSSIWHSFWKCMCTFSEHQKCAGFQAGPWGEDDECELAPAVLARGGTEQGPWGSALKQGEVGGWGAHGSSKAGVLHDESNSANLPTTPFEHPCENENPSKPQNLSLAPWNSENKGQAPQWGEERRNAL